MYNIYKITNDINSLVYIGCTTQSIEKRLQEHLQPKARANDFHNAIKEIGKEHFRVELLEQGDNDSIKYEREKYYISLYKSNDSAFGYNRTVGGAGTIGYVFTKEDRKKISLAGIGRKPTLKMLERISKMNKGKHLTKECRDKISKARIGKYTGEDNPFFGKHHTEETKQKIYATKKERGQLKPVIGTNLKTNEEVRFDTLTEAGRYIMNIRGGKLSTLISHIGNSIVGRGLSKSAYGYKWIYKETSNDYPDKE